MTRRIILPGMAGLLLVALLAACASGPPTTEDIIIPTLAVLPTATPTPGVLPDVPPDPLSGPRTASASTTDPAEPIATFAGEGDTTLDALTLAAGLYDAHLTTDGTATIRLLVESGDCGVGTQAFLSPVVFSVFAGDAADGMATTVRSDACTTRIEVSDASAAWELAVYPVN